jgi:undecaprenyl-diphosphatase
VMIDRLLELDKELFLFLNGYHVPWMDPVMKLFSITEFWLPLHAFLLWQIVRLYKTKSILILVAIAITITMADQITTSFMKPFFERLRPSHEPSLEGLVHLVNNYRGGKFGFASSHAANTFGVALFLTLLFRRSKPWMAWLFLWAALVSYTRIYLGVHYPGDILVGAIVGMLCALVSYAGYTTIQHFIEKRKASAAG